MALMKLIPVEQLRPGMFVSRLDLSWFKHPYLTSRVGLLSDGKSVEQLKALGLSHVEIDPERGLDVEAATFVEESVPHPDEQKSPFLSAEIPPPSQPSRTLRFARKLFTQAMKSTKQVFKEAEAGKPMEIDEAKLLVARLITSVKANENVVRLLCALRGYDEYTYTHSVNVAAMGVLFGSHLGLPEDHLEILGLSGLLHDVGKCLLPKEIVNKPGRLTEDEFNVMKSHAMLGWEYVKNQPGIPVHAAKGVLEHHERIDGSGYPKNLMGEDITGLARILSVLDSYDALTSNRVYRTRMSPHMALKTLYEKRGITYPRSILDRFITCVGVYPPSSVVQLRNGFYAVVTGYDPHHPLHPRMTIFRGPDGRPVKPRRVETLRLKTEPSGSGYEIARHVEPSEVPPPDFATWL